MTCLVLSQSPNDTELDFNHTYSEGHVSGEFDGFTNLIPILICSVSVLGLLGNGAVIWLLGFRIKRTPFTTLFMNLAVADFGVLLVETCYSITFLLRQFEIHFLYSDTLRFLFYWFMYNTSQFILTVISVDRCVSVLFPLWHRCQRPTHLATILCTVIWIVFFLWDIIVGSPLCFSQYNVLGACIIHYHFFITALVCTPFIIISTSTLFIKLCRRFKEHHKRKASKAILFALLFYLTFAFPVNVCIIINSFSSLITYKIALWSYLSVVLNSSVNPLIYFLTGRRKGRWRESLMVILQRLFRDEEESTQQSQPLEQNQL